VVLLGAATPLAGLAALDDAVLLRLLPLLLLLTATGWKGQGFCGISFCDASCRASASR
jgi:hypothetical protein